MTLPQSGAPNQPRKHWIVTVILALSLTLNLCFIGGLVYTKFATEAWMSPQQRVEALAGELSLTAEQRQGFEQMIQVLRLKGQSLRAANGELVAQVWEELEKPQPDQDNLSHLLGQIADNRRQFQIQVGMALATFFAKLTPEQRSHFIDLAHRQRSIIATRIWRLLGP
jgi:uncharacterized membrane protein